MHNKVHRAIATALSGLFLPSALFSAIVTADKNHLSSLGYCALAATSAIGVVAFVLILQINRWDVLLDRWQECLGRLRNISEAHRVDPPT
jgi:hypothetical protein